MSISKEVKQKIEYFCESCGGTDVLAQGWCRWNMELQEWGFGGTASCDPIDHCNTCEFEATLGYRWVKS